jgi:tetratricopeptide (TPR) repeat protein
MLIYLPQRYTWPFLLVILLFTWTTTSSVAGELRDFEIEVIEEDLQTLDKKLWRIGKRLSSKPDDEKLKADLLALEQKEQELRSKLRVLQISRLVGELAGPDWESASAGLVDMYDDSPEDTVGALSATIQTSGKDTYSINTRIAITLAAVRDGWVGSKEQRDALIHLTSSVNYDDPEFRSAVDEAIANYRNEVDAQGTTRLEQATAKERQGFEDLVAGRFDAAIAAFQEAESIYPSFHQVYEIARVLEKRRNDLKDEEARRRVLEHIVSELAWEAPDDLLARLKAQLEGAPAGVPAERYEIGFYSLNVSQAEHDKVKDFLTGQGYRVIQGAKLDERPAWLSTHSTVLFYDERSNDRAGQIALSLRDLLDWRFAVRRGAGLGVSKGKEQWTFFVHYIVESRHPAIRTGIIGLERASNILTVAGYRKRGQITTDDQEFAEAVGKFQTDHGLTFDGILGPKTAAALKQLEKKLELKKR